MPKDYPISKNDAGQRLDKFILKLAPELSKALLYRTLRKKDIRVNGKPAKGGEILKEGDVVSAYLHSKFFSEEKLDFLSALSSLETLYEDERLLIVYKPAGLLMHPNRSDTKDSMSQRLLHYLYLNQEYRPHQELTFRPAFVNRLDRNTSGLVLGAKDFPTLQLLNEKMKQREIVRKYLAVVNGHPSPAEHVVTGYWRKDGEKNKVEVFSVTQPDTKEIQTRYKVLKTKGNCSLLEIELITGRSHQIRGQLAALGHPLVGDVKYGASTNNGAAQGQELVAFLLAFDFKEPPSFLDYLSGKTFQLDTHRLFPSF